MAGKSSQPLSHCAAGSTLVEFAMVLPVLLLLVAGIVEYSIIMYASAVLEGATNSAAREGTTNYYTGTSRQEYIYGLIQQETSGILNSSQLAISAKSYAAFTDIGQPEPCIPASKPPPCTGAAGVGYTDVNGNGQWDADMGVEGLGGPGDIVVYTVTYPWTIPVPLLQNFLGTTFTLTSSAVVQNEPASTR